MKSCIQAALMAAVLPGVFSHQAGAAEVSAAPEVRREQSVLPFFRELAEGYELPEPFGVNLNYMQIRQGISVDRIRFSGLHLGRLPLDNIVHIDAGKTRQKSHTGTLRFDAWVFPFMNLYGLLGKTTGQSVSDIRVRTPLFTGGAFPGAGTQNLKFRLDFQGTTYGVGTTLVGGMNNWFTSLDANYTQTRFDILDGHIDTVTFSPRVGYYFDVPSVPVLQSSAGRMSVWVGGMYQDVEQRFRGKLNDLNMPSPALQAGLSQLNKTGDARFDVRQHLKKPWNMLAGIRYDPSRHFSLIAEAGFEKRKSFFVSGEYRF
ncbi:hypothetical protein JOW62_19315 [Escherichia coli]